MTRWRAAREDTFSPVVAPIATLRRPPGVPPKFKFIAPASSVAALRCVAASLLPPSVRGFREGAIRPRKICMRRRIKRMRRRCGKRREGG